MINDENKAKLDQGFALLGEALPAFWRRLYDVCQENGFTPQEAFALVQTYILSQCPNGVKGVGQ